MLLAFDLVEMDGEVRVPAGVGASLRLRIPPNPHFCRSVRQRVTDFATNHRIPEDDTAEFVSAVAEALVNALEHAHSDDTIEVSCWIVEDKHLFATVVDHGIGFPAAHGVGDPQLPDPFSEGGRGLPIMRRFTDLFSVRSVPGEGTAVTLGRSVRR